VANANHLFLANWIKAFPEFAGNSMYLIGESYAGIYVPTIVRTILNDPQGINLKGFAVGDGCIGTEVICGDTSGPWYSIEFFHGHGQVSEELYNTILSDCPEVDLKQGNLTQQCNDYVTQMWQAIGGYYDYNLYDDCIYDEDYLTSSPNPKDRNWWGPPRFRSKASSKSSSLLGAALTDYACPGSAYPQWVNLSDARKALNVPTDSYYFDGDNGAGFNYTLTEPNLLPFYQYVIEDTDLHVLVYNGDTDPGINSMVTQDAYFNYFKSVGISQTQKWRPWTLDGNQRMGGYVTEFQGDFSYLTIRGSGHMVPEFKPQAALSFLTSFLAKTDYLPYVAP